MGDFSKKLLDYRNKRGWSRQFVSDQTEISIETLKSWEKGTRVPPEWAQGLLFFRLDKVGLP